MLVVLKVVLTSSCLNILADITQGSVLGLLLFQIYINVLPDSINM